MRHLDTLKKPTIWQGFFVLATSVIALEGNYNWFYNNRGDQVRKVASWLSDDIEKTEYLLIIGLISCATFAGGLLLLLFWQWFTTFVRKIWNQCDTLDKKYITVSVCVMTLAIIGIYSLTNIFSNTGVKYDVVYSSDTGSLCMGNVWLYVNHGENDIRQPLFAIASIPFSSLAALVGRILYLWPNVYTYLLAMIQGSLLILCNVLVAKMLKISGHVKIIYYLLASFAYSNILFTLNLEQYVFAVFYMILFIYHILNNESEKLNCILLSLATGSLISTAVICVWKERYSNWKDFIKMVILRGLTVVGILSMFGRLSVVLNLERLKFVLSFSSYNEADTLTIGEKILQYLNLVKSLYIQPEVQIVGEMNYRLSAVNSISVVGCLILFCVVIGFFATYKERLSQIGAFWILFSFGITVIVGWGARENGMILYALYFCWAFTILLMQLLKKVCERWNKIGILIGYVLCTVMLIVNSKGIMELVQFGIEKYPH